MAARPVTPSHDAYGSVTSPIDGNPNRLSGGYGMGSRNSSYLGPGTPGPGDLSHSQGGPMETSPLAQTAGLHDGVAASQRDPSFVEGSAVGPADLHRSDSQMSQSQTLLPSRGGTLKKKASMKRSGSLKRSSSRRSSRAGSVQSLNLGEKEKYGVAEEEMNSAFWTPVPTQGNPTEILATRFQAWRKLLKDLVTYFRDIQKSYETKSKSLLSVSNVINNTVIPSNFLTSGGIGEANTILREYHKQSVNESNKARDMENEVIGQLTGLRSDLQQKIKEIKSLAGDFKNSVDKETELTRKQVRNLQDALGVVDHDAAAVSGKGDPYLVKMAVDRQLERQIEEENYLHRAYLNLESSGRELESIVVGEIQKAYNALASIIKRESDEGYEVVEKLRDGPIAMAKDHEWDGFVTNNEHLVDPRIPIRNFNNITYTGKDNPAATEIRSGMLERKSKYLKSYTPGWYVLSPTHLHEFKSADRIASQAPVMSLYLPEQKLGSHSDVTSSSHKFMLKGRQTGGMHRGHAWVFRAETHDTMIAWFNDIRELTESSGAARDAFVRRTHARSLSGTSQKAPSIGSSEGAMEEDEADAMPYSTEQSLRNQDTLAQHEDEEIQRPQPGGRFPSDVQINRDLHAPLSPSSGESSGERDVMAAAGSLPGSGVPFTRPGQPVSGGHYSDQQPAPADASHDFATSPTAAPASHQHAHHGLGLERNHSNYGEWMAPAAAAGTGGAVAGAAVMHRHEQANQQPQPTAYEQYQPQPAPGTAEDAPILVSAAETATDSPTVSSRAPPFSASEPSQADSLSTIPTSAGSQPDNSAAAVAAAVAGATHAGNGNLNDMKRPTFTTNQSTTTISDLHVPGGFPKSPPVVDQ